MNALAERKQLGAGKIWKMLPRAISFSLIINSVPLKLMRIFSNHYFATSPKVLIPIFSVELRQNKFNPLTLKSVILLKTDIGGNIPIFQYVFSKISTYLEKSSLKSQFMMHIHLAGVAVQVCISLESAPTWKKTAVPNTTSFFILTQEIRYKWLWWTHTEDKWNSVLTFINSRLNMLQHTAFPSLLCSIPVWNLLLQRFSNCFPNLFLNVSAAVNSQATMCLS